MTACQMYRGGSLSRARAHPVPRCQAAHPIVPNNSNDESEVRVLARVAVARKISARRNARLCSCYSAHHASTVTSPAVSPRRAGRRGCVGRGWRVRAAVQRFPDSWRGTRSLQDRQTTAVFGASAAILQCGVVPVGETRDPINAPFTVLFFQWPISSGIVRTLLICGFPITKSLLPSVAVAPCRSRWLHRPTRRRIDTSANVGNTHRVANLAFSIGDATTGHR